MMHEVYGNQTAAEEIQISRPADLFILKKKLKMAKALIGHASIIFFCTRYLSSIGSGSDSRILLYCMSRNTVSVPFNCFF